MADRPEAGLLEEGGGAPPPPPPPPLPPTPATTTDADHHPAVASLQVSALSESNNNIDNDNDDEKEEEEEEEEQPPPVPPAPPSAATSTSVAAAAAADHHDKRRRGKRRQRAPEEGEQQQYQLPAPSPAGIGGPLKLPPGVAPVADFTSLFCSVSAVALTLLATTLPFVGTTHEEERQIHKGLLYYMLSAITVLLFFFKMQTSLEHAVVLLAVDQAMLGLWLLGLVLLPVFLHRVIRYGRGRGSVWDWSLGMVGNTLLLGDYCLLAIANLGFDASLCCHPHHRAMVYPRGQAGRRRRLQNGAVGFLGLMILGMLELFIDHFTHDYVLIVPLLLGTEQVFDLLAHHRRHRRHHRPPSPHPSRVATAAPSSSRQNSETSSTLQRETPHMALVESADGPSDVDSDYDSDFDEEEYASHNGVEQEGVEMTVAPPQQEEGRPSNHQDQRPPQPPQTLSSPPPMTPAFLLLEPSGLSLASAAAIRTESVPPHRVHPHPRHAPAHRRMLPWWYALRVKRLRELRELFHGTTGTALTLLGTTLPFMKYDGVEQLGRFSTCLFMYFWAALAVLLYHTRMRQMLSFRRFLFLPEVILLCVWMILIVLIPKFMEAVALFGGGTGFVGEWTPAQVNNTRLLVVHVFHNAVTVNFAASLLYWEQLLARRQKQKQKERDRGQREEKKKERGGGGGSQQSTGLSLRKLVVVEVAQLALSVILLGCQMSFEGFSNQYVYILPAWMLCMEVLVHFGGGRATTE